MLTALFVLAATAAAAPQPIYIKAGTLIDGRADILGEVENTSGQLREYLRAEFDELLADYNFTDAISGHLAPEAHEQDRSEVIIERLRGIAGA